MIDLAALDAHLAAATGFAAAGNKQRALEELGDARGLVREAVEELVRPPRGLRFKLPPDAIGARVYGTGHPPEGTFYPVSDP